MLMLMPMLALALCIFIAFLDSVKPETKLESCYSSIFVCIWFGTGRAIYRITINTLIIREGSQIRGSKRPSCVFYNIINIMDRIIEKDSDKCK